MTAKIKLYLKRNVFSTNHNDVAHVMNNKLPKNKQYLNPYQLMYAHENGSVNIIKYTCHIYASMHRWLRTIRVSIVEYNTIYTYYY